MQQRFAEFLVFGGVEGPMTQSEAALAAGYSPNRAKQEAYELLQMPKIQKYLQSRANEVNRGFAVTKTIM